MLFGLIMIYQISPQYVHIMNELRGTDLHPQYIFTRQLINVALSLTAFIVLAKVIPYELIKKSAPVVLIFGIVTCIVLAIAGALDLRIAQCSLGACRWINLGFVTFQPAELLKLGLVLYLAVLLGVAAREGNVNKSSTLTRLAIITGIALMFVVIIQRDLGTGVVIACITLAQMLISGINKKTLALIIGAAVIAAMLFTVAVPHRRARLMTFLKGDEASISDDGSYHIVNAKIAIGSGGFFGVGIGNSVQSTGYLPESISDSIFAIIGETFGFIGLLIVIGLFAFLLWLLLRVTYYSHDPISQIISIGVFGWIAAHVFMNIAAMIGIIPLTGITLPFLSSGGTSMIFIATALGIVSQLSCYTSHTPAPSNASIESPSAIKRRTPVATTYRSQRKR